MWIYWLIISNVDIMTTWVRANSRTARAVCYVQKNTSLQSVILPLPIWNAAIWNGPTLWPPGTTHPNDHSHLTLHFLGSSAIHPPVQCPLRACSEWANCLQLSPQEALIQATSHSSTLHFLGSSAIHLLSVNTYTHIHTETPSIIVRRGV